MIDQSPLTMIDFYKADHRSQYPNGTGLVFSNWTARKSRIPSIDKVVFFGLEYYLREYLVKSWNQNFFRRHRDVVVEQYQSRMQNAGIHITVDHIKELHDYGKLPIAIYALPEGTHTPIGVPMLVMWNTNPKFFWLTNYLETSISQCLWGPCTSASIAFSYRRMLRTGVGISGGPIDFVDFQGHDFSSRGMYGPEAAAMSGAGHLLSFKGTDTVHAIDFVERYYKGNPVDIGGSVPATEHSVMCMGGDDDEIGTFKRLLTEVYPTGPVSVVADTWDYWKVLTEILPKLKQTIMKRDGCLIIRPDSGDPVSIICGDPTAVEGSPQRKGSMQLLWDLFGGTTTNKAYRQLDPHIGLIYGDSITLTRCSHIISNLIMQRFVPSMVLGIGSYTYQHVTRDTFGFAMKATYGEILGTPRDIFKDPKTDDGEKKSAKGLLAVHRNSDGELFLRQGVTWGEVETCEYVKRFHNGTVSNSDNFAAIRRRVCGQR